MIAKSKGSGKDAHWEGHCWGRRGSRKKGQMLQKQQLRIISCVPGLGESVWVPLTHKGLVIQQVVRLSESFLEKENPYHGISPLPDIFLPRETRVGSHPSPPKSFSLI